MEVQRHSKNCKRIRGEFKLNSSNKTSQNFPRTTIAIVSKQFTDHKYCDGMLLGLNPQSMEHIVDSLISISTRILLKKCCKILQRILNAAPQQLRHQCIHALKEVMHVVGSFLL